MSIFNYVVIFLSGNFANTKTGNTMTVSKMSMSKKETSNSKTDEKDGAGAGKSIWPSFFKMNDNEEEQVTTASSKTNKTLNEAKRYVFFLFYCFISNYFRF